MTSGEGGREASPETDNMPLSLYKKHQLIPYPARAFISERGAQALALGNPPTGTLGDSLSGVRLSRPISPMGRLPD